MRATHAGGLEGERGLRMDKRAGGRAGGQAGGRTDGRAHRPVDVQTAPPLPGRRLGRPFTKVDLIVDDEFAADRTGPDRIRTLI